MLSLPKDIDIELSLMDGGDHQPQVKDAWLEYVIFNKDASSMRLCMSHGILSHSSGIYNSVKECLIVLILPLESFISNFFLFPTIDFLR